MRIALGIRAQLLLALTVFLVMPFLGYEYVRELERFLRDAQEQALAGTAQALAAALHDRPRLFDLTPLPLDSLPSERGAETATAPSATPPHPAAVAEIAQILHGLSRTPARIWVIDRDLRVLARSGSLSQAAPVPEPEPTGLAGVWRSVEAVALRPIYLRVLQQPVENFGDDRTDSALGQSREVTGALAGVLTVDRRATPDGRAQIVAAAQPVWVGDQVRGAVIVEETTNAVLAERNRAFERLFNIVLAALLVGSLVLTAFASVLTWRIRRLRDDAEAAIDAHGRVKGALAESRAGDEIGDLSRSLSAVLARLARYASYQENMASRLSHELRTPVAVVRSSLDNLNLQEVPAAARVYIERAHEGISRLAAILTRMTEATRLEGSLADAERTRIDLGKLVAACVEGYRTAYPGRRFELAVAPGGHSIDGAPDLIAQMLDKLVANADEFGVPGTPVALKLEDAQDMVRLAVRNDGPPLPEGMRDRLFDSMVSVRPQTGGAAPHLGLGLYIVRLVAEFHGGAVCAENRVDGGGVEIAVTLPRAAPA
jgi:two-component system sensor histidine kinase ChvG